MVVDIPEAYGLILSRDWSTKLNGYFATDWSHLWLRYNNNQNQFKILREPHMTYNVTSLEVKNEPVNFLYSVLGNHFLELELENHQAKQTICESYAQSDLLQFSRADDIDCNIVDLEDMFWILYFNVECKNDTAEYEAPGMKTAIELNVRDLKVFGNYGENPFQQQLRETHPKLEPLIQKELRKLDYVLK